MLKLNPVSVTSNVYCTCNILCRLFDISYLSLVQNVKEFAVKMIFQSPAKTILQQNIELKSFKRCT